MPPTKRKTATTEVAADEKENTVDATTETSMQKARSAALSRIRDAHRDEYNQFLVEEAAKLGIEWKPKASPKERAAERMRAMLEEFPELKDELASA